MADFNVAVVDDEYLIRQHIIKTVDWAGMSLNILFEAESGEQALSFAAETMPDILIADINMPGCSGIELTEQIHERDPDCAVIILTGFNDFKYLQGAIRAGVLEYLEKPLDKAALEDALVKAIHMLGQRRRHQHYVRDLEKRVELNRGLEKEALLRDLVFPRPGTAHPSARETERFLGWRRGDSLALALLQADAEDDYRPARGDKYEGALIYPVIREAASSYPSLQALLPSDDRPVLMGNPHHLRSALGELRILAKENLGRTISAGLSREKCTLSEIKDAYREAEDALEERFFHKRLGGDYSFPGETRCFYNSDQRLQELFYSLNSGDEDSFVEEIEGIFSGLIEKKADRGSIDHIAFQIISFMDRMIRTLERDLSRLTGRNEDSWENHIACFEKADRLESWLVYAGKTVLTLCEGSGTGRKNRSAGKARDYIRIHYGEKDLNLQKLADEAGVSPGYLSKLYKKVYGKSIIEDLCEYRLKEAKTLLEGPVDTTVYEVAESVGFADPLYFSKVFKRHFGASPRKFRKKR